MILVTIGTMLPFDRLVQVMDRWAESHPEEEVFAQIGDGQYEPKHMPWVRLLPPGEFGERVRAASLVVAHAGTGSFFLSMEMAKPVVMLPRLAANREHTTDHQVHTARWLAQKPGVFVAMTDEELPGAIERAKALSSLGDLNFSPFAPAPFIERIRAALLA